ncbi:hypothetical protein HQ865_25670 [Mucilaginibacter mali]|jgi:hypothetical protein|uniref:CcoQ/FixQ family Cbb3-type cytochrome c oxidase assembly chaperone n=1 Tax=Mucilaginibacter mali TaxID=2740462 RepID=A0A7D4TY78_9SPHI|nr:hypothetical protein [Mucilaginibacter mali]QKJ32995.1 hypothetical protein HQ865_25670 [Mucilaginibacter mali]
MFKQFTEHLSGNQIYLLASLWIFLVFFIVVAVLLVRIRKAHIDYMGGLPLEDNLISSPQNSQP